MHKKWAGNENEVNKKRIGNESTIKGKEIGNLCLLLQKKSATKKLDHFIHYLLD